MLEIRLQGSGLRLDLPTNEKIDWEEIYHLFGRNSDLKSWQFNLPKTPSNRKIATKSSIDAPRETDISLDVEVFIFGESWSRGPLYFLDETPDSYRVSFAGQMGYLLRLIDNRSLRSFDYPSPTPVNMWDHAKTVAADPEDYDYIFPPIDLPSLRGDIWWPAQINSVVIDEDGDFDRYPEFWRHFDVEDFNPSRSALEGTSWAYLEGELVKYGGKYYRANVNVTGAENPADEPSKWTQELLGNVLRYNPMVPQFYVMRILKLIATELGFEFSGDLFNDPEIDRLFFFNTVMLNEQNENEPGTVPTSTTIHYADHLPDVLVADVLKALTEWFNQRIEYRHDEGLLVFVHREDDLQRKVRTTLQRKVQRMEIRHREKRTYNLGYNYNQADVNFTDDNWTGTLEGIEGEEGSTDVISSFSTLPMRYGFGAVDPNWLEFPGDRTMEDKYAGLYWRPVSALPLNAEVPQQWLIYRLDFLYTAGPWSANPKIPMASSGFENSNLINDKYSLYWQGDKGLFKVWWEKWIYAIGLAKIVRLYVLMQGIDRNRQHLLDRQALSEWVFLVEELKLSAAQNDTAALAEMMVLRL